MMNRMLKKSKEKEVVAWKRTSIPSQRKGILNVTAAPMKERVVTGGGNPPQESELARGHHGDPLKQTNKIFIKKNSTNIY